VTCSGASCTAPTGSVSLQAKSSSGDFLGLNGGDLTPNTPTSVASVTTGSIPGGAYDVNARYSGDGKYYASTSSAIHFTVSPEQSQMALGGISGGWLITSPLTLGYAEPVPLWVGVAGKSGYGHPSGTVSMLVDGAVPNTVARDFQTPATLTLNYGEKSSYFGSGTSATGQSSVFPNLSPGYAAGTHQVEVTYPGDSSF